MTRPASLPGRLLEPCGDARPRGMAAQRQNPAYRLAPSNRRDTAQWRRVPLSFLVRLTILINYLYFWSEFNPLAT